MKKCLLLSLLCLLMAFPALSEGVQAFTQGQYTYILTPEGAVITAFDFDSLSSSVIDVPDTLGGQSVVSIADYVFDTFEYRFEKLLHIRLPRSLRTLSEGAFHCCHDAGIIELPASLEVIPENCFFHVSARILVDEDNPYFTVQDGCLIDTRTGTLFYVAPHTAALPAVRRLGDGCLANFETVSCLTLPDGLLSIGAFVFYDDPWLETLVMPDTVDTVSPYAIYASSIKSLTLSRSLTRIPTAFCDAPLESVLIPASVEMVEYGAFSPATVLITESESTVIESCESYLLRTQELAQLLPDGALSVPGALGMTQLEDICVPDASMDACLVIASQEDSLYLIILEKQDGVWRLSAQSDTLLPLSYSSLSWSLRGEDGGFILQSDQDVIALLRDESGVWQVARGAAGAFTFALANGGTALAVYSPDLPAFSTVLVPLSADLSVNGYRPAEISALCEEAKDRLNDAPLLPATGESDALPQGDIIAFAPNRTWPVYAGPGTQYARLGDRRNAVVSTNDWIQVLGQSGDWLLIQYNISDGRNRFGYISAQALPRGVSVPALTFTSRSAVLTGYVTDDPLRSCAACFSAPGEPCTVLGTLGSDFLYVEALSPEGALYRGFMPAQP